MSSWPGERRRNRVRRPAPVPGPATDAARDQLARRQCPPARARRQRASARADQRRRRAPRQLRRDSPGIGRHARPAVCAPLRPSSPTTSSAATVSASSRWRHPALARPQVEARCSDTGSSTLAPDRGRAHVRLARRVTVVPPPGVAAAPRSSSPSRPCSTTEWCRRCSTSAAAATTSPCSGLGRAVRAAGRQRARSAGVPALAAPTGRDSRAAAAGGRIGVTRWRADEPLGGGDRGGEDIPALRAARAPLTGAARRRRADGGRRVVALAVRDELADLARCWAAPAASRSLPQSCSAARWVSPQRSPWSGRSTRCSSPRTRTRWTHAPRSLRRGSWPRVSWPRGAWSCGRPWSTNRGDGGSASRSSAWAGTGAYVVAAGLLAVADAGRSGGIALEFVGVVALAAGALALVRLAAGR